MKYDIRSTFDNSFIIENSAGMEYVFTNLKDALKFLKEGFESD